MQRISIIGNHCSGKSTLAERVGQKLHLPVHHLDFSHNLTFSREDESVFNNYHRLLLPNEKWILEGIGSWSSIEERTEVADLTIFLDQSQEICKIRALNRVKERMVEPGSYLTEEYEANEPWQSQLTFIEDFHHTTRPKLLDLFDTIEYPQKLLHFREVRDTSQWMEDILDL